MKNSLLLFGFYVIVSFSVYSQGSGNAMDFSVNSTNYNNVTLDSLPQLDTASFTVEMWVNLIPNTSTTSYNDAPLFCNKDWNHGQNIGIALHQDANGYPKINYTTTGSPRIDYTSNVTLINKGWQHLAVVFDRHGDITFYVNGNVTGQVSIASTVGSLGVGLYPYRIAQDGTGTYGVHFNGMIDEFRLWKGTRTQTQIRDNMCHKLTGVNPSLLVYYNFDNVAGTNVPDLSGNNINGTIENSLSGIVKTSGAAIGDTSTYLYSANYSGQSLQLSSPANGNFNVSNIQGHPAVVQVYQVNAAPNNHTNISAPGGNNVYYGVYIADSLSNLGGSYTATYNYSNYPNAVTYDNYIALYTRLDNSTLWSNTNAVDNTGASTLTDAANATHGEYIIGNFTNSSPTLPTAISGGYALDFQPNSSNNNNVDIAPLHQLDSANFTIEFWANCRLATPGGGYQDAPFISNKNWASGSNVGMVLFLQSTGAVCANFRGAGGSRVDIASSYNAVGRDWTHIALTINRQDSMIIYVNGVELTGTDISASVGTINAGYDFRLGNDGTGAYEAKFNGAMDEVRIWKGIRTPTQIRENMCKRVTGSNTSLVLYYRLDEGSGTVIHDQTPNQINGTLINQVSNTWIVSPAPIGDTSFYLYPAHQNWSGQTVTGTSPDNGSLTVQNVMGYPQGMHVYRVDSQPLYTSGLHSLTGADRYFGVFPAMVSDTPIQYYITYDYSGFGNAVSNASSLQLSVTNNHASTQWTNGIITNNTSSDIITLDSIGLRREFIIDSVSNVSCLRPMSLVENSSTTTTATFSWVSGGSNYWNVRYGPQGVNLLSDTAIYYTTANPMTVSNLTPGQYYDVYVQDSCAGESSEWLGPLRLSNAGCGIPDSISISNITKNSASINYSGVGTATIFYGLTGFNPDSAGSSINTNGSPTSIYQLQPNTTYDVYIRVICGSNLYSGLAGPYTFTTLPPTGINEIATGVSTTVYPNPSHDGRFAIESSENISSVRVYDLLGNEVCTAYNISSTRTTFTLPAQGVYMVRVITPGGMTVDKIVAE